MTIAKELNTKTTEELVKLVIQLKGELLADRFKLAQGELTKTHQISQTKKVIAIVLTILTKRGVNWQVEQQKYKLLNKQTNEAAIAAWKKHMQAKNEKRKKNLAKRANNINAKQLERT